VSAPAQITILIPDPAEMMFVTGNNDANIDRIEREFGVKIVSRGAELRIMGDPGNVARVGELVSAMRTISDRDENLRKPALERLIGEAKDAPVGTPELMRDVVATTVRGKRITPQSANQRSYVEAIRNHDLVFATGPAGTGKCIASDSLVLTDRGMVEIGSLGVGLGADEADSIGLTIHGIDGPEPASLVYSGGVSDTLTITTRFGYSVQVTPEHPLLVRTTAGELEWRRADQLTHGDVLALQRGQRMFGNRTQVDFIYERRARQDHSRRIAIGHLDEDLAYFMGIVTGDGNVTARNRIGLSSTEPEVIAAFRRTAQRFGLHVFIDHNDRFNDRDQPDHVMASSQLYQLLSYLGMSMTKAQGKCVPRAILAAPESIVCAFLRGLYDTDGSLERGNVVSLTLTSDRLIREVQILLLNLGIVSSNAVKRGRYRGRPHLSRRLVIAGADVERFFDHVGFAVSRKCSLIRPLQRNANVDLVPFVSGQLLAAMRSTTLTREQHHRFQDYRGGRWRPSYSKLTELVGILERQSVNPVLLVPLQEILKRQLLFLPVVSILPGQAAVYDLTVPGSHSFIANGFVNHNSYLAVALGVAALRDRKVARLILTRPAVEAGERLGFLPGDLTEKIDPYLRPLYDALYELMPPERFARAMERGEIEVAPLAFMRGRSLNEAFIILDEAQNATPAQMKMFLTRLGYGAQAVVNGDITQIDLEKDQRSGLVVAREILKDVEGIAFVDFNERDVVRHELVARIVRAYDRHEKK
jgi:phosphate starvation-inducible protein PhoH/intein/homing endonuclease